MACWYVNDGLCWASLVSITHALPVTQIISQLILSLLLQPIITHIHYQMCNPLTYTFPQTYQEESKDTILPIHLPHD